MLPILTPEQSAALDRASADRGIGVAALMENAGWAVARAAASLLGGAYGRRVVVVAGKGNNGGDGLVAARFLGRWGMAAAVVLLAPPGAYRDAARTNFRRFADAGGRWRPFTAEGLRRELDRADLVIDALFGTGFRGSPQGEVAEAIDLMNRADKPVVAVDIPSGVEGETGLVRGRAVRASLTVTFGALKPGVVFFPGAASAGIVEVADIGFPADLLQSDLAMVERTDAAGLVRPRPPDGHKWSSGVVLVVAGSRTMTGAGILAGMSAYRAGAGLVTIAVPEGILSVVQEAITEATFLPLPQTDQGSLAREAADVVLARMEDVDAAAIGPGLGTEAPTVEAVRKIVAASPVPFVLDADGLNAFTGQARTLADRRSDAVLTPHPGEFGRLAGLSTRDVLEDRVGHARKLAAEVRAPVLLKGSRTVVAEPDGRATVNPTGGSFLATGGTGDVLTGAIAAFLARGLPPADAARLGAYVHGMAGQMAAAESGEGTTAGDVSGRLAEAVAMLGRDGGESP